MARFIDFIEVKRHLDRSEKRLLAIQDATASRDAREAWEDFLTHWHAAVERILELAETEPKAKPLARLIKAEKGKNGCPAISYCWILRNIATHRLEFAVKAVKSRTNVGRTAVVVEGDSNVTIGKLTVDGVEVGKNIVIGTKDGVPVHVEGLVSDDSIAHEFDRIELPERVTGRRSTEIYIRPIDLDGKPLMPDGFIPLGQHALAWARSHLKAVKEAL